jgi:diacylglycerol kinase
VQSALGIIVLIFAWLFQIDIFEWIMVIMLIGIVLLMELINSAVERVSDVLKPRIDNYVKEIKDIMAAAVMLASIISIVIGIMIFFPYFYNFL